MWYRLIQTTFSKQNTMQRTTFLFFVLLIMSLSQSAYCQYLPIGILPMEYNPSFAGSVGNSRLVNNFTLCFIYNNVVKPLSNIFENLTSKKKRS